MTPGGEKALRQLLEVTGIPEAPALLESPGLLQVREQWLEDLLSQLTMQLLLRGVSVTDKTFKATLTRFLNARAKALFPPFPPIGRKRGNEIAK
jgi:hypothetical protein